MHVHVVIVVDWAVAGQGQGGQTCGGQRGGDLPGGGGGRGGAGGGDRRHWEDTADLVAVLRLVGGHVRREGGVGVHGGHRRGRRDRVRAS